MDVRRKIAMARMEGRPVPVDIAPRPVSITTQKKPCGCDKRKAWLNKMVPGAGDLVEVITTATGIKRLVQGD